MSVDWYRRHLGTPAAPQRPQEVVPQRPTQFVVIDGKAYPVGDNGQPAVPDQQWGQPQQPWRQQTMDPPLGEMHALDAAGKWRGTRESQQVRSGHCPECGGSNYMPRLGVRMGHCFGCGYREPTGDDRSGPTLQRGNSNGVRGLNGQEIPVEQARSVSNGNRFGQMVSGRLSQADVVGRAG